MMSPFPSVAILVRGVAPAASQSVRALRELTAYPNWSIYLVVDDAPAAEAYNRAASQRDEDLLLFWEAGLTPTSVDWLGRMVRALALPKVGAAVGMVFAEVGSPVAGLLTPRDLFERLGNFDSDRLPERGYLEDYLVRLVGLGSECVAVAGAEFLAGAAQLTPWTVSIH